MKIYTYRSGHKTLKKVLSITLSLLVLVQMTPAAFVVNSAQAIVSSPYGNDPVKKITLCHDESGDGLTFHSSGGIAVSAALSGHTEDTMGQPHYFDIIPPFYSQANPNDPVVFYAGQNWNAVNEDIWFGGGDEDHRCTGDGVITPPSTTGTLTLVKSVTNDNGGTAVAGAWTLSASGATNISGTIGQASVTAAVVTAGDYDLSETGGPTGYTLTGWSCSGGSIVDADTITVAVDANVTCTATNNDVSPKITVTKVVTNNSQTGTSTISDFSLSVGNTSVTSGVEASINAGSYTVSESGPTAGYTATFSGDCAADGSITLSVGDVKTCTITNDDNPLPPPTQGTLKVTKIVVNDDLTGSSVVGDFTLYVGTSTVVSGEVNNLYPGSYVVSEGVHVGYNSTISGDCDANGNVSLLAGQVKECTITNDDIARDPGPDMGNLIVTKVVINDNNTATKVVADFPLFVGSTSVVSGNLNSLIVGSYVVSETYDSNEYHQSFGGDCDANGNVNVSVNATSSCTITNNDIAPTPNDEPVLGCMDVDANNYNSNATQDDGTCTYTTTTSGGGGGSHRGGGIVLGINNDEPQGQVLGATFTPGLPATGNGPINTSSTNTLAVLFAGLMVLAGLNMASFKALKLEVKSK